MEERKILILANIYEIEESIRFQLEAAGYIVYVDEFVAPDILDIIILTDGCEGRIKKINKRSAHTLLLVASLDKVVDLYSEINFEDFIIMPCNCDEFLLRVELLLHRSQHSDIIWIGSIKVDRYLRQAFIRGTCLSLKPKEFALLEMLADNLGNPICASELYEKIWGTKSKYGISTVTVHMSKLRKKMEDAGCAMIKSKRSIGYWIEV